MIMKRHELAQQVIYSVSKILARDLSDQAAFTEMLKTMCGQLGWAAASFWILDETSNYLKCEMHFSVEKLDAFRDATMRLVLKRGEGLPGQVWLTESPIWMPDVTKESNFPRAPHAQLADLHAAFALPVTLRGKFIGVFEFFSKTISEPDTELVNAFGVVGTELGQLIERRRFEAALLEYQRRFEEFASVVDEVFFVSSPNLTQHFYVSPAFERIWGFPVSKVFERADAWIEPILPQHQQRVLDYVALLSGDTMPDRSEIDYPIRKPDGSVAWLSARCFRMNQPDGSWHICGTVRDITERKQSEQRISDFYSMVSHELRTPMTSIKASLILLEREKAGVLPEEAQDLIQIARKESDRLIRLVNDMLDIKIIEVGKLQLSRQQLSPSLLINESLALAKTLALENDIQLNSLINTDDRILADKDRILQVLTNLVSNALKFSPRQSTITIRVDDCPEQPFVRFSIIDSGPGISEHNQSRLFKVFQQIEPQGNDSPKQGTGLGLAICKGIIDQHAGQIGMTNNSPAPGSTFWFELPKAENTVPVGI